MKESIRIIGLAALLALGVGLGVGADRLWQARFAAQATEHKAAADKAAPAADDEEPEAAAIVHTVIAVQGDLPHVVEGLGTAAVPPGGSAVESWPMDVIVTRVLVQAGEAVSKDSPLVQVSITRDAETQTASARLAVEATAKALDLAQQRLDRGLATRPEVLAAQTARDEARQRLDRLLAGLPPQDGVLRARSPGIIAAVRVQAGSTVPAGTPMFDITSHTVAAQIGIDPGDVAALAIGQTFEVRPIDDRLVSRWTGTLSLMAPVINPVTRLVDATLTLTGESLPRPGTSLRAVATLTGVSGVLVPRAALVPEAEEMIVFVVRDGTAVRTPVTVAGRGDQQVILAGGCVPGDHVVVSGQSQLTTGAVVREAAAPMPAGTPHPDGGSGADH